MADNVPQPELAKQNVAKSINRLSTDVQLTLHRIGSLLSAIRVEGEEIGEALCGNQIETDNLSEMRHRVERILDFAVLAEAQAKEAAGIAERVEIETICLY